MEPAKYDITIHQGATFELSLQYKDSTGTPVNMSGYTVSGQVWDRLGTTKYADFVHEWISQVSGSFRLKIPASGTSGLTQQAQYDVLMTEPGGDKHYLLNGAAFIDLGLTGR